MPSVEFWRPRLRGARFDDGQIPLQVLSDLNRIEGNGDRRGQMAVPVREPGSSACTAGLRQQNRFEAGQYRRRQRRAKSSISPRMSRFSQVSHCRTKTS